MKRVSKEVRQQIDELRIQLVDQGCKKIRDALVKDFETTTQLIRLLVASGRDVSPELREIAGLWGRAGGRDEPPRMEA